jgi:CDP-diacylglycerol--glycerol-3-phosphate 3-phosphatidyltransferase
MIPIPSGAEIFVSWNGFIDRYGMLVALFLFVMASITDFLDGQIARRMGIVTNVGKLMDPIADKLLVVSVLMALTQLGRISSVIVIIILAREFLITGLRLVAVERGKVIAADITGKLKTASQMTAVILLLLQLSLLHLLPLLDFFPWAKSLQMVLHYSADAFVALALAATVYSGIHYIRSGMIFLRD